jgi:two-component system chemotaxis response regulator CheY
VATRVLITDDTMFMRTMLRNILTEAGFEVVGEAANGREAIDMYARLKPDVVTMDITMPEMDGITALKRITTDHPDAKVVMCTAMGQQAFVREAILHGAKDFIVKPFQAERVVEAVRKLEAA